MGVRENVICSGEDRSKVIFRRPVPSIFDNIHVDTHTLSAAGADFQRDITESCLKMASIRPRVVATFPFSAVCIITIQMIIRLETAEEPDTFAVFELPGKFAPVQSESDPSVFQHSDSSR